MISTGPMIGNSGFVSSIRQWTGCVRSYSRNRQWWSAEKWFQRTIWWRVTTCRIRSRHQWATFLQPFTESLNAFFQLGDVHVGSGIAYCVRGGAWFDTLRSGEYCAQGIINCSIDCFFPALNEKRTNKKQLKILLESIDLAGNYRYSICKRINTRRGRSKRVFNREQVMKFS